MHDHAEWAIALFAVLSFPPFRRILARVGMPRLWALLVFVPIVGHVALYALLASRSWPNRRPSPPKRALKPRREA